MGRGAAEPSVTNRSVSAPRSRLQDLGGSAHQAAGVPTRSSELFVDQTLWRLGVVLQIFGLDQDGVDV